nr:hypothetical protein BaRGS_008056 [Batillaria attramentaria]
MCSQYYDIRAKVCEHLKGLQRDNLFRCGACNQKLVSKYDLSRHKKHCVSSIPIRCRTCGEVFSKRCSLVDHVRAKHSQRVYTCTCGSRNHQPWGADGKIQRLADGKYQCTQCGYLSSKRYHLNRHLRLHSQEFFQCSLCPRKFYEKCRLVSHLREYHTEEVDAPNPKEQS